MAVDVRRPEGTRPRPARAWLGAFAATALLHAAAFGGLDGFWPRAEAHGDARAPVEVRLLAQASEAPPADAATDDAQAPAGADATPARRPGEEPASSGRRAPAASTTPATPATASTGPDGLHAAARPLAAPAPAPTPTSPTSTSPRAPNADPPAARVDARAAGRVADDPSGEPVPGGAERTPPPPRSPTEPAPTPPDRSVRVASADPPAPSADPPAPSALPLAASPVGEPIPHYRTRMPPSITLRYDVRRGALSGAGEIAWRREASRYDLRLEFRYAGLAILQQASSGGFDAEGVAPLRFLDQRIRRAATAANFRRETGQLTYSGSGEAFALLPGTQDRLSWMVQLAAIVAADPSLAQAGGRVTMAVTGARGDLAVWTFRALGTEGVDLRPGRVEAARFVREARHEHDVTVQAWLDPARHWLPVAASQQSGPGDEPYELRLVEATDGR